MKENIKNTYISPVIEVFEATSEDVISTSGFDGNEDVLEQGDLESAAYNF